MSKEMRSASNKSKARQLKYSVGNDIGKNNIDTCISVIDEEQKVKMLGTRKFDNSKSGIKALVDWVERKAKLELPIFYVMEATGIYYEKLAWHLSSLELPVSVLLPTKAKRYLESIGYKSKNDKTDSIGLARMGAEQNLSLWQKPDESILHLRGLTRQREKLQETKTNFQNQLDAYTTSEVVNKDIVKQLNQMIKLIKKQVKENEKSIIEVIKKDSVLEERVNEIVKVGGLGIITVATVIAETNAFKLFNNTRQLVSYAGYDIVENQSGSHVGRTKISKKGNSHIRRILFMPAFTAVKKEPIFNKLYTRVFERTKKKMKGYVAVQRKLLVLIYTLWKSNESYDREYSNRHTKPLGMQS